MTRRARTWSALAAAIAVTACSPTGPGTRPMADRDTPTARTPTAPPTRLPRAGATVRPGGPALTATGGRPFAARSAWNTPIPAHPKLAAGSAAEAAHLAAGVHADLYEFGTPVFQVPGGSGTRQDVGCLEDWGPCLLKDVPMPDGARPSPGSDGSMIVVDAARRKVFDFWRMRRTGGGWAASWGTANPLYGKGDEHGGAVGAGFSGLAGLVRAFEIRQGRIDHALHFSTDNACAGRFAYPATKTDGASSAADCVPEGARVQLDPSVDVAAIPGITPGERTVARAMQVYGAYNRDNGGAPMAFGFENPAGRADPYPAAGLTPDYYAFPHIPWKRLRVLASWNGE
jgi:hypothetical protein